MEKGYNFAAPASAWDDGDIADVMGDNEKAREEAEELAGYHSETLFDENEDRSGERVNIATGEAFDNTHDMVSDEEQIPVKLGSRDVLPKLREKNDAAAQFLRDPEKWLRENSQKRKKAA